MDQFPGDQFDTFPSVKGFQMLNKRFAAAIAGTALAASAIIVPQATAQTTWYSHNNVIGYLQNVETQQQGSVTVFVPSGQQLIPLSDWKDAPNCFTHNGNIATNYNGSQLLGGQIAVTSLTDESTQIVYAVNKCSKEGGDIYTPPSTVTTTTTITVTPPVTTVVETIPVTTTVDNTVTITETVVKTDTVTATAGSSLGLSSASSDESAPVAGDDSEGPATGPVAGQDAKADAQKPATGPVGGQDPKAAAQAQAANAKNVPAGTQAAPQAAAATPVAQQKQLANTGVEGTIIALAVGLIAAAAGAALLVLRRRRA